MKRITLSAILFAATASFLHAAPCPIAPLSVYEALGSMGCTIGVAPTFTFKNFGFQAESGVTADQILVTPSMTANSLDLNFSSEGFQAMTGQRFEYVINYLVDPPPPEIIRFSDTLQDGASTGPASAQVTTSLCIDPQCPRTASVQVFDRPGAGAVAIQSRVTKLTDTTDIFPPSVYMNVSNDLILDASAGGTTSIVGFTNSTGIAPEPVSIALVGCGLLGLAMWRARAKVR